MAYTNKQHVEELRRIRDAADAADAKAASAMAALREEAQVPASHQERYDTVRAQRDALLAALEALCAGHYVSHHPDCGVRRMTGIAQLTMGQVGLEVCNCNAAQLMAQARATIAAVEAEGPL